MAGCSNCGRRNVILFLPKDFTEDDILEDFENYVADKM